MGYTKLPSSGVRRGVQIVTSLMLTLQIVSLAGTIVFFLYAKRSDTKDVIAKSIITTLYHREDWKWMRRTGALQFHIMVSFALQLLFLVPTCLMLAGAARRARFLLLPWLVVFGLLQVALVAAVIMCVVSLPDKVKILGAGVAAVEAFIVFPWWFTVLHLFAVLGREEEEAERLSYMSLKRSSASASAFPVMTNSAAHSWSYGGGGTEGGHQHNHRHDQQCRECAMLARDSSTAKFSDLQCVI